jgi:Leucine-rich repeat (LRR) protein
MAAALGAKVAAQLGWNAADHSTAELCALGEQLILDHALHADDVAGARLLVALTQVASAAENPPPSPDDAGKFVENIAEFLAAEFKAEFAVCDAATRLAALRMPRRPDLARELLQDIGLDPDRRVDTAERLDPENMLAGNEAKNAADYYLNYDALSAGDIRNMGGRPLSDADIAAKLAALPASLDAEFARQFNAYTQTAADETAGLVDGWLSWIARKHGVDLQDARIELSAATLQYYRSEVQVLRGSAFVYDGPTLGAVASAGYIATVHAAGQEYRYFLSTADGSALPMPADTAAPDWALRHPGIVFGLPPGQAGPGLQTPKGMRARVALEPLGQGKRDELSAWFAPAVRGLFDKSGEAARGQTPGEHAVDTLPDFIPFRRMVVAIRAGDIETALVSGGIDVMTFAIPMLCAGLRLAAGASSGLVTMARQAGRVLAGGDTKAAGAAMAELPGLRAGIESALARLNNTGTAAHDLRPLDADAMAWALRGQHPRLANALDRAAVQARGTGLRDGWWRVRHSADAPSPEAGISVLEQVPARSPDNQALSLLPYGDDSGRAYTQVDPMTGERRGIVLLADSDGWLYLSLPAATLARYRVSAPDVLRGLGVVRGGADGTLQLGGKTYARIAGDYVEITAEHASTTSRPAWRVLAPPSARRDIVTHRLFYDRNKALWRRADMPALKGGGITPSSPAQASALAHRSDPPGAEPSTSRAPAPAPSSPPPRKRPLEIDAAAENAEEPALKRNAGQPPAARAVPSICSIGPSALELDAFREVLLGRIQGAASGEQVAAVRDLLTRLEGDPRGKAILGAMQPYYQLRGEAPRIVLLDSQAQAQLRPTIRRLIRGPVWHLDLPALNAGSLDGAVQELAVVYNNMTGILHGIDPFVELLGSGGPPINADLENAWARWIGMEEADDAGAGARASVRPKRRAAIDRLRRQLREARCYGGLDKRSLQAVLKGRAELDFTGLKADLAYLELSDIPPLPGDVHTLDVSGNPIRDWSGLPSALKVLNASKTGRNRVPNRLPVDLIALDVSFNSLRTLSAALMPRGLRRLKAEANRLTEISRLPDTVQRLLLSGNDISVLPTKLPRDLKLLDLSNNGIETFPVNLPTDLLDLDLSENRLTHIPAEHLPPRLESLELSHNPDLRALPSLPATLRRLWIDSTGLDELPANLPRGLHELYAADLGLTRLPDSLPTSLTRLELTDNELTELPRRIVDLTSCGIFLEGNPLAPENLPSRRAGIGGPVFHFSMAPGEKHIDYSRTLAQAVRRWLDAGHGEAARHWDAIGPALEGASGDAGASAQLRRFIDELRATASYANQDFRASVQDWLVELSKPERKPLLESTMQACATATERCDDRVALTFNELKKMRAHDDIRIGRYDGRPAEAIKVIQETFRLDKLRDIAYRKIKSLGAVDDVEVYLAYTVKLREPLELVTVVPEMRFFTVSQVSQAELDAALREVREAERAGFYRELVLDDTWNAYIKPKLAARYEQAEAQLHKLADAPLQEKIRAELQQRGLDPDDLDAQRNIAQNVWHDMKYEVMEPLTRDYLTSRGLPLPAGAPG